MYGAATKLAHLPPPTSIVDAPAAGEIACVKATSFAGEIAPELVPSGERALFMYATPANYIASILAGENSVQELRTLAGSRSQRLNSLHGCPCRC